MSMSTANSPRTLADPAVRAAQAAHERAAAQRKASPPSVDPTAEAAAVAVQSALRALAAAAPGLAPRIDHLHAQFISLVGPHFPAAFVGKE
jgi:hypothetical protein